MLEKSKSRLLLALQKRTEREDKGLCIIEGEKLVKECKDWIEFIFSAKDTPNFREVIHAESLPRLAAVARIPQFSMSEVNARQTVLVLDGIQDPGNVGGLLRSAAAFGAGVILVECAEVSNPKTIRASAGGIFKTPWITLKREGAEETLSGLGREIWRLEKRNGARELTAIPEKQSRLVIVGNEGQGIRLEIEGESIFIPHAQAVESLNVLVAASLVLFSLRT